MIRRRAVVKGRVQGVFFRASVLEEAQKQGVFGWVRNLPDGDVEAVFEGTQERVQALLDFCAQGPRWARVEEVQVFDEEAQGIMGFEIR